VCLNSLSVRVGTVETRLVAALREHVLEPAAIAHLVAGVNQHLTAIHTAQEEARQTVAAELAQIETELRNIEDPIVHGLVGTTTAALLQDREARRDVLRARLQAAEHPSAGPLRVGAAEIRAHLDELDALLKQDPTRANAVFRQILEPITMTPVEQDGRRFYRATGAARGAEMLESPHLRGVPGAISRPGASVPAL
jgi:hypothetical protein